MKDRIIKVPAKMVAAAAQSSLETVNKVRAKKRTNGKVVGRVKEADEMLQTGISHLIKNVQAIINN